MLLRRGDLDAANRAMAAAGFVPYELMGILMFIDGVDGSPRDAVQVAVANEKVRATDPVPAPDVLESEPLQRFRVVALQALLRMKLTAFRRKDQVHVLDRLEVGLIDGSWKSRLPAELAARLQTLIETPEGEWASQLQACDKFLCRLDCAKICLKTPGDFAISYPTRQRDRAISLQFQGDFSRCGSS